MSQNTLAKLINALNLADFSDGTAIGANLKISRAAVWKNIKKLQEYGVDIESQKSKGYRLTDPLILLDAKKIRSQLKVPLELILLEKLDSTNDYLKQFLTSKKSLVCLAETQIAGKGRFNRQWYSPFGQNIYLSLLYFFQQDITELSGLSLVLSMAICHALESVCQLSEPLKIKWPNDILYQGKKLAGILIEIQAESNDYCAVINGMGINVNMLAAKTSQIKSPWISLRQITQQYHDRNILCAAILNEIHSYLQRFESFNLNAFKAEWQNRDALYQQNIELKINKSIVVGSAMGINEKGHLILQTNEGQRCFSSGDIALNTRFRRGASEEVKGVY